MIKVVVPFTQIAPGVAAALNRTGYTWWPADVSASDESYWMVLDELWSAGESFIIVEHDVLVRPSSLQELENCPHPWCGFETAYFNGNHAGMGCVKFTAELIQAVPNALDLVANESGIDHPPRHWCRLDAWLQWFVLPQAGQRKHLHTPALAHWRAYDGPPRPSHGCMPEGS